jgi:hypothetical protein
MNRALLAPGIADVVRVTVADPTEPAESDGVDGSPVLEVKPSLQTER